MDSMSEYKTYQAVLWGQETAKRILKERMCLSLVSGSDDIDTGAALGTLINTLAHIWLLSLETIDHQEYKKVWTTTLIEQLAKDYGPGLKIQMVERK